MTFDTRLHTKFLVSMMLIIVVLTTAVYFVSVPWIEQETYSIELEASQTILDNVYEMSAKVMGGLKEQRALTIDSFQQNLRTVVRLAATYVEAVLRRADAGEITAARAQDLVFEGLRDFRYGANDYVWVTDYRAVMVSHPDPSRHGRDASEVRDERSGVSIIPTIVEIARRKGEGFHEYTWARLGSIHPAQKISYFVDMPHRSLVIGSGAYLDDIEAEVEKRKEEAVEQLRAALREIRIAKTGYAFIFDASNKMLIHPNANIEGAYIDNRIDPASGKPIGDVLRAAADTQTPVTYLWDKPSDPGNYTYQKISSVRHFKELNWYVASSVYVDELKSGARRLRNRILAVFCVVIGLGALLAYVAARRLAAPLQRLADAAKQVQAGNLDVQTQMARGDEIGVLAAAFQDMIAKVRAHRDNLETLVRERTRALQSANHELQEVNVSLQRSKEDLADAELRQRRILDGIPAAIAYLDSDERIRFLNKTAEAFFEIKVEHVLGARLSDAVQWSPSNFAAHLCEVKAGASVTFDHSHHGDGGRAMVLRTTLIPHIGPCGEAVGFFVLSYDTTDEKAAEQRLRVAERLMAVGQLSGGLAHDFNNLLSIIIGNLACAEDKFGSIPELSGYLQAAQRAGRRGADITDRLLAFSRKQQLREATVDIGQSIHDVGSLVERSLPSKVIFSIAAERGRLWTYTDAAQLETMLVNLAFNARDAMPDGGDLEIMLEERTIASAVAFDQIVAPGRYVEIRVRDTGEGFSAGTLDRAFDPFFTTKTNGSGLGLSMVYGLVKQSKGYITIASEEGAGTCVTILLPRVAPPAHEPETSPALEAGRGSWVRSTALVCEDDRDVRRIMVEQLVGLGFSVVEAENGDEAVRMLACLDAVDLVVTDVVMPGLSGIDVVRDARALHPAAASVYCTGFTADIESLSDQVVLKKPWQASELTHAIQLAMSRAQKAPNREVRLPC